MSVETVLRRVSREEEQWARQLFREKAAMDYRSGMGAAREEGEAAGLAKGRKEGRVMGYDQARLETGRTMKADGFSADQIAKYTGLPFEAIAKL
jgi:predicted transposase/invertase (TIGR01784 family)